MNFGFGFVVGVVTTVVLVFLFDMFTNMFTKRKSPVVPEAPEPTLTDEERKKIREALTDSGDAELARKLLEQLKRRGGE